MERMDDAVYFTQLNWFRDELEKALRTDPFDEELVLDLIRRGLAIGLQWTPTFEQACRAAPDRAELLPPLQALVERAIKTTHMCKSCSWIEWDVSFEVCPSCGRRAPNLRVAPVQPIPSAPTPQPGRSSTSLAHSSAKPDPVKPTVDLSPAARQSDVPTLATSRRPMPLHRPLPASGDLPVAEGRHSRSQRLSAQLIVSCALPLVFAWGLATDGFAHVHGGKFLLATATVGGALGFLLVCRLYSAIRWIGIVAAIGVTLGGLAILMPGRESTALARLVALIGILGGGGRLLKWLEK
jgi:hypothetical protein